MSIEIRRIGCVRVSDGPVYSVQLEPEYWDAVLGLEQFSHIIVLWWISGCDTEAARKTLRVHPRTPEGAATPLSGVFATRSPKRPNPIGLSVVRLIDIVESTKSIVVDRIDAFEGSPVIDIKPYMPSSDRVHCPRTPEWASGLPHAHGSP
ncbi:MAG: tRNA (N6-threonylcarbamoyladenosine(37)-N6)-methyltransferase TrmO [Candidatus Thorarchaeota archaeon]|nr:tRNA (N6-threonylcarbamoyladenosine(37)-N6)-methyltransferase TrmO [Candidatus Thorarchaeota archaeon]